jgi:hypothetical protein
MGRCLAGPKAPPTAKPASKGLRQQGNGALCSVAARISQRPIRNRSRRFLFPRPLRQHAGPLPDRDPNSWPALGGSVKDHAGEKQPRSVFLNFPTHVAEMPAATHWPTRASIPEPCRPISVIARSIRRRAMRHWRRGGLRTSGTECRRR